MLNIKNLCGWRRGVLFLLICLILALTIWLLYIFAYLQPSNNRQWELGMGRLTHISIQGKLVTLRGLRDWRYDNHQTISTSYIDRTVDINKLNKTWFVVEPFIIQPYSSFKGVAHTYFVFDFEDQEPLVVSVEARREKGEKYDSWAGLFNQYELIYIWGTEKDITGRRVLVENNKVYMYPLQISKESSQQLFLQMVTTTQELEKTPRFYNTLTSNCTNELAKSANKVNPQAIPFNKALFFPGYAVTELYKLRFLPTDVSVDELPNRYFVSDLVKQYYSQNDFSNQLREHLPRELSGG